MTTMSRLTVTPFRRVTRRATALCISCTITRYIVLCAYAARDVSSCMGAVAYDAKARVCSGYQLLLSKVFTKTVIRRNKFVQTFF